VWYLIEKPIWTYQNHGFVFRPHLYWDDAGPCGMARELAVREFWAPTRGGEENLKDEWAAKTAHGIPSELLAKLPSGYAFWRMAAPFYFDPTIVDGDIYEFGVFSGASMKFIHDGTRIFGKTYRTMWGFDSFEGLPEEDAGVGLKEHSLTGWLYGKGKFSSSWLYNSGSPEATAAAILKGLADQHGVTATRMVVGYYNKTLTSELLPQLKPAVYVDIDCDLYNSTIDCLDFLLKHRLIVTGTLIGYDDWALGGYELGEYGESRAHAEMCAKYDMECTPLIEWNGAKQMVFRVDRVGTR